MELVLVAVDEPMAAAWDTVAAGRDRVRVHRGSVTDLRVDGVVSPANSFGWMRGGIDGVYYRWLPGIEDRVRAAIASAYPVGGVDGRRGGERGGRGERGEPELPVGSALIVPTGAASPAWLISAPTMRLPGELLDPSGEAAGAAARAILRCWRSGRLPEPDGRPVRVAVDSLAVPGLGTGVGGLSPAVCAARVAEAIDELLG
jgi:O-acetyl-ADP-ribose deacetylase (regulator of RNase III)